MVRVAQPENEESVAAALPILYQLFRLLRSAEIVSPTEAFSSFFPQNENFKRLTQYLANRT